MALHVTALLGRRIVKKVHAFGRELGSRVEAFAIGADKQAPPGVVFVLSHMRSGSTLLSHLLGEHPEILGAGEQTETYRSAADLDASVERVFRDNHLHRTRERWIYDQINHDRLLADADLLRHPRVRTVFLLREPVGALCSMIELFGVEWYWTAKNALDYYESRLRALASYAEGLADPSHGLLLTYEQLTAAPASAFAQLSELLQVENRFSETYRLHAFTGLRGDAGTTLRSGRIRAPAIHDPSRLDRAILVPATEAFQASCARIEKALRR